MIPEKTISDLIIKHSTLEKELSTGEVEKKKFADKSKEYADLNEIIENLKQYNSYNKDKEGLKKILDDESDSDEMKEMAQIELDELEEKFKENEKK